MQNYTEIFKALSDETRLRIIYLLATTKKELCCCELTDSLEEPPYNISKQLKILKNAGLVESRKEGKWVYFSLQKHKDPFTKGVLGAINSLPPADRQKRDKQNLMKVLSLRKGDKCLHGVQNKYFVKTGKSLK
ncbi:MAG: metalloregulator ArsR/SmtB family transcription factor [bacterium]